MITKHEHIKVAVGLSGGVDSAVAGALLIEQGYDVTGVFLICYQGPGCRTDEDRKDALDVALKLKIPFEVLDFRKEYQVKVLEYFKAEYKAGRTPNPDIVCNKEIKFGLFYDWAMKKGFDYMATGHYACVRGTQETRNKKQETRFELQISKDKKKDQTYFLYQLREKQLAHILFPIGGMTKDQVRAEAKKRKLPVAKKPDSQGICFVGEVSVPEFLKKMGIKEHEGVVVDLAGKRIGTHKGAWFVTIGQRHGFTVEATQANTSPLYVISKNIEKNEVVVGMRQDCMRSELVVGKVHWINKAFKRSSAQAIEVRIRHGGELINARFKIQDSRFKIFLEKPVFGVAPGQSCVFYKGKICLGGGVIV